MRKKFVFVLLIILLCSSLLSCSFLNEYEAGIDVANKNLPSVLELTCSFQASVSHATGFIIDDRGFVLTNAHVVTDSVDRFVYDAVEIKGNFYNSSKEYLLNIIDYDIEKDLALLKFQRNDLTLKAVSTGNSDNLSYGATIFTLGNAEGNRISMTKGIISVPKISFKDEDTHQVNEFIQIDAAINNGSSGGPVMDIKGNVIGIISFKIKKPGTFVEGIGFAIPSKVFLQFYEDISQGANEELDEPDQTEELDETENTEDIIEPEQESEDIE